jgi:hypothetical protein
MQLHNPLASLDAVAKRKILAYVGNRTLTVHSLASPFGDLIKYNDEVHGSKRNLVAFRFIDAEVKLTACL